MDDKTGIIIACCFIFLIGIRLVFVGLASIILYNRLRKKGQLTKALINAIDHKKLTLLSRSGDTPILTFTVNDQIISGVAAIPIYTDIGNYKIGEEIEVYYEKSKPKIFVIKKRRERVFGLFLLMCGLFIVTASVWGFYKQMG